MVSKPIEVQGLVRPQIDPGAPQQSAHDSLLLPAPETTTETGIAHQNNRPITPQGYLSFFALCFIVVVLLAVVSAFGVRWFRKVFYTNASQKRTNAINAQIIAKQKGDENAQDNSAKAASARLLRDQAQRRKNPDPALPSSRPPSRSPSARPSTARRVTEDGKRPAEADTSISEDGAFSESDFVKKATPAKKAPEDTQEKEKSGDDMSVTKKPAVKRAPRKTQPRKTSAATPTTSRTRRAPSAKKD